MENQQAEKREKINVFSGFQNDIISKVVLKEKYWTWRDLWMLSFVSKKTYQLCNLVFNHFCRDISFGNSILTPEVQNLVPFETFWKQPQFQYVDLPKIPEEYKGLEEQRQGCWCAGDCRRTTGCPCVLLNQEASMDAPTGPGKLWSGHPAFECHDGCCCKLEECSLRCSQQPFQHSLYLSWENGKGVGVRTFKEISEGAFICEYVGEIISTNELGRRRAADYDLKGSNYVLSLVETIPSSQRILKTHIDATKYGNVSRFFNHSCSPSMRMVSTRRGSILPRVLFYSSKKIAPHEELTFNYSSTENEPPVNDRKSSFSVDDELQNQHGGTVCLCGAPDGQCGRFLPAISKA